MTDLKSVEARRASAQDVPVLLGAPYAFYPGDDRDDSIDLLELARLFYRERRLITVIAAAFTLISLIPALTLPPRYRAEALLVPVTSDGNENTSTLIGQLGGIAALVGGYVGTGKDRSAESIATLRSRSLAMDFIRTQNLKPQLFPTDWNDATREWRDPAHVPTDLQAYQTFDSQVRTVVVDRQSGMVSLQIEWRDPVLAAAWANRLVTAVNQRRREEAISEAQRSIKYAREQLAETSSIETQQSLYRLIEAQTKTIALANARHEYAFRVIDPAVPPETPIRPRRIAIIGLGLVVGLLTAITVVLLRRAFMRERALMEPAP